MGYSLSGRPQSQIDRFCRQYLQLEQDLTYPEASVLREHTTQQIIFSRLFSHKALRYAPPVRYQVRNLKDLIGRIEASIEDWDAHEVSGDLMNALAELLASALPPESDSVQQKSFVTYHLSQLSCKGAADQEAIESVATITLLESRTLISAYGTTGLRTWEAGLHLGQYLCANPGIIGKKRVLELGAGTGYLAILCAKYLDAAQVIASDGSSDVINNLPESFFLNDLQGSDEISAMELKWGHGVVGAGDKPWSSGEAVDVILGADITYDERGHSALIATLIDLLTMFPGAEVLISAAERSQSHVVFQTKAQQAGLGLSDIDYPSLPRELQMGPHTLQAHGRDIGQKHAQLMGLMAGAPVSTRPRYQPRTY
ncbi:hypothetical protein ACRALDRAFT_1092428 [Sodiomyces alcalophilus JCM 7366]|uniref:uncharacterized protein n=1 Tax=Sodiomyces alcalophilus JCM 7366 TaxID=591952 RepID=UPI0039B4C5A1